MKVPSSSRKRYLGGADWCVAALSQGTVEMTGRRCIFQIAILLDGVPDFATLARSFRSYCDRFPVLWGKPSRCWCLAPFWKFDGVPDHTRPVPIGRHTLATDASGQAMLRWVETLTNDYAARDGWRVALDLGQSGAGSCVLVFSFDHVLFDAAGAESFIQLFFRHANGEASQDEFPEVRLTGPAYLEQWAQKFKSGQTVNRMMRRLAEGATAWLTPPSDACRRPFRFRVTTFSEEDVRHIRERAFAVAGYLMFMPYALASAAAAFRPFFMRQSGQDAHFVVSVSTDKPKTVAVPKPHFFFNELSFLYFRFAVAAAGDRNALAGVVREQFVSQVKECMPAAMEDANLLMRILPARQLWRFLMRFYRNRLASFGFTCLGESKVKLPAVLGCAIRSTIHFPVIPTPPGIGLVLNPSGGVYHAVLSYIEGALSEEDADALMADFRKRLLDEPQV